jgi:hypothetical protein
VRQTKNYREGCAADQNVINRECLSIKVCQYAVLINFLLIVLGKISGDVSVHETIYMLVCAGDKMVSVCMSRCVYVCAMPLTLLLLYFKLSLGCLSEAPGVLSRFRFCIPS